MLCICILLRNAKAVYAMLLLTVVKLKEQIRQLETDNHLLTEGLSSVTAKSDELASRAVELQSQLSLNDQTLSDKAHQLQNECHELQHKVIHPLIDVFTTNFRNVAPKKLLSTSPIRV